MTASRNSLNSRAVNNISRLDDLCSSNCEHFHRHVCLLNYSFHRESISREIVFELDMFESYACLIVSEGKARSSRS